MSLLKFIWGIIMDTVNLISSLFSKSGRKQPRSSKSIESTREVIGNLKASKTAPPPPQIQPLKIRSERDWKDYEKKLYKLDKLERFVAKNSADPNWKWFAKSLDKVKKDISKMTPYEFDEYTTETVVKATVDMSRKFIAALDSCGRMIKNPTKDSTAAKEFCNLIEEYLLGLGIRSMDFKVGGDYEKWADLGMSETPIIEGTNDRNEHNTLKEIYTQPHFIDYINEHDKKSRRVFGGQCAAYAFRG